MHSLKTSPSFPFSHFPSTFPLPQFTPLTFPPIRAPLPYAILCIPCPIKLLFPIPAHIPSISHSPPTSPLLYRPFLSFLSTSYTLRYLPPSFLQNPFQPHVPPSSYTLNFPTLPPSLHSSPLPSFQPHVPPFSTSFLLVFFPDRWIRGFQNTNN